MEAGPRQRVPRCRTRGASVDVLARGRSGATRRTRGYRGATGLEKKGSRRPGGCGGGGRPRRHEGRDGGDGRERGGG
jgi:hypothetical protein